MANECRSDSGDTILSVSGTPLSLTASVPRSTAEMIALFHKEQEQGAKPQQTIGDPFKSTVMAAIAVAPEDAQFLTSRVGSISPRPTSSPSASGGFS
jgi:hypothetical protein